MNLKQVKKYCLVLLCIMVLTGCGSKSTKTDDNTLRVGVDLKFYPFMYIDHEGYPAGLEVDIANAFGENIGKEVEIVNTDFSMLIPALDTGDIDIIISDMSAKPDRIEKVDFSIPYRYAKTLALVNKTFAEKHDITTDMSEEVFFNIEGMKFAGLAGTIASSLPQSYGANVTEFTDITSALMEVTTGKLDVLIGANTIWGDHAANLNTTIVYDGIKEESGSCFAVKKGNVDLLAQANQFIESMYQEDGFYMLANDSYDDVIGEFMQNDELTLDYIIYSSKDNDE